MRRVTLPHTPPPTPPLSTPYSWTTTDVTALAYILSGLWHKVSPETNPPCTVRQLFYCLVEPAQSFDSVMIYQHPLLASREETPRIPCEQTLPPTPTRTVFMGLMDSRIGYFSVAVVKHHHPGNLWKKACFDLRLQKVRAHNGGARMAASGWKRKLGAHTVYHKHKAERASWKSGRGDSIFKEKPSPVTYS